MTPEARAIATDLWHEMRGRGLTWKQWRALGVSQQKLDYMLSGRTEDGPTMMFAGMAGNEGLYRVNDPRKFVGHVHGYIQFSIDIDAWAIERVILDLIAHACADT